MKPTVTDLLKLLDKPALVKWANKLGLDGTSLDSFYEKKREEGISLHKQVENFLVSGVKLQNHLHQEALDRFMRTRGIVGVEKEIETEWFKGRYDVSFRIDEDLYIGDFKTNDKIYFEHKLQLAAYQMALPEAKICVIHLPLFTVETITEDLIKYQEILKRLSEIYLLKKEIEEKK